MLPLVKIKTIKPRSDAASLSLPWAAAAGISRDLFVFHAVDRFLQAQFLSVSHQHTWRFHLPHAMTHLSQFLRSHTVHGCVSEYDILFEGLRARKPPEPGGSDAGKSSR